MTKKYLAVTLIAGMLLVGTAQTVQASAKAPTYANCTSLNKTYKHGVGRAGARDKTSGTPVTTFTRNTAVYNANTKSDRDKDGIACEKR